ncbi:MAG TPA: SMC family ATPase [Methanothrix sp.]|nr:SMC family ATPase [Methanothrix sp.]HQE87019.1 SMC family ATPase [Methanothrix sp.]HQI67348.1 SMC family ATPase [Methanothrix sp.]HRS84721.1 SMC family ATPase [Methanothrix sp.]HRT16368.1 SMC family ATPase [Methanothrix sp.]
MHLNRLVMYNFKKFRRSEIDFSDGLTGIVGSNGAGKSTIVEAIAWSLYGNRASGIKRDFIKNARAGPSDSVETRLTLSLGRQELVIYRAMRGRAMTPEAVLVLDGQRIASGSKEVDGRLEEILKISYQDFMKTFYARQKDLDNLLREGGVGKREYLLKLLGLEDIKECAIEQIKSDKSALDGQRSRLAGALEEIGDVSARQEKVSCDIAAAQAALQEEEGRLGRLAAVADERRRQIEVLAEKMRRHGLLAERLKRLAARREELEGEAAAEERRLALIASARRRLAEIEPQLLRLASVRARLSELEPKRAEFEIGERRLAAEAAALQAERKALSESDRSLSELEKEAALLEALRPDEEEHSRLQERLAALEGQRDRHTRLQSRQKELEARLQGCRANCSRSSRLIDDLYRARARMEEIAGCMEEEERRRAELEELIRKRERQRELAELSERRRSLEERQSRLNVQAERARAEAQALSAIEAQEEELRRQDRELDRLGSELARALAELRGSYKAQEMALAEAERALKKAVSLGEEGLCPACERPLEGQRGLLLRKYERAAGAARQEKEALAAKIASQTEAMEGVARSRSNLRQAFDDLGVMKSRRSAIEAELRSLGLQQQECQSELEDMAARIEALGEVDYDEKRLLEVQAALQALAPLVRECSAISVRLEKLAGLEEELEAFKREEAELEGALQDLSALIMELGFSEKDFQDAKKRQAQLKPTHDRFILLSERAARISALQRRRAGQAEEIARLESVLKSIQAAQERLGYRPEEYLALQAEKKELAPAESEQQKINALLAGEEQAQERLQSARLSLQSLCSDIQAAEGEMAALGYSEEEHELSKAALAEAEMRLEEARRAVSERRVRLGVLQAEAERLDDEARRKQELEASLSRVERQSEVVETVRGLVNDFMDQVLIRVKNDIARTAGEILEEVSGKYSLLKIDDDFNIQVEDGGSFYPISRYSGGEIDMIAVSVRVAISEYLMRFGPDEESYSFLILDEIFGSQDQEHREKMIQMLRNLERRFPQIIAISHISDVQGQFDCTLQVVEDEMGNSRVEVL